MVNYLFECSCPIIIGLHLDNDSVVYLQIITRRKWTLCKLYYEYISCLYFIFCCKRYEARISAKTKGETSLLFFMFSLFLLHEENIETVMYDGFLYCLRATNTKSWFLLRILTCECVISFFDDSEMHLSKRDHQVGHIEITWKGQRTENTPYHIYWTFPEDCLIM